MEVIGFVAGLLTLFTYVPQSIKTIKTRKTRDLSLSTLVLLSSSAVLWVVYGLHKSLVAVWLTNSVVTVLGIIILSIKIKNTGIN
jgi:MtN3 and saliva related transmembrane protein